MLRKQAVGLLRMLPLLVMLLTANACQSHFGARTTVMLQSEPPGAEAYLIPVFDWDQAGGTQVLHNQEFLDRYRVGETAVEAPALTRTYIYVVKHGDSVQWGKIFPAKDQKSTYTLKLDEARS